MTRPWIPQHQVAGTSVMDVGGKALGLAAIAESGLPVPPFAVVTTACFDCDADTLDRVVSEAVSFIGEGHYAVRSSATVEDGAEASFAGQFVSVLGVGSEDVADAVRTCWASAEHERVRAYAEHHGVETGPVAVVIQVMIEGSASGVMFTRDPDDPGAALVSVGLGLGEGVVQGLVPCDTYRVRGGDVEAEVADKDSRVVLVDGQPVEQEVSGSRRTRQAIDDHLLREIVDAGRYLERMARCPLDIEFTVKDGRPVFLQARPITAKVPFGRRLLWDNSNIVESYSGITTPLTFSFASRAYTIVYQLLVALLGVSAARIQGHQPVFRRMIGLIRGRVYYNLDAWYQTLSLLPGFAFNRGAMEQMMGVSEEASDEDAGANPSAVVEGVRIARTGAKLLWRLGWLKRDAAGFRQIVSSHLDWARGLELDLLRADELLEVYEKLEQAILWSWTPPLVNDLFCMIFYALLKKEAIRLTGDPDTQLHNELLSGSGDLASAAPVRDLARMAERMMRSDRLKAALSSDATDHEVLEELWKDPASHEALLAWFGEWGDRSPDELKLECPSLRDTPEFVVGALRGMAKRADVDNHAPQERSEAEGTYLRSAGFRRPWSSFVLSQARHRVAMREVLRLDRTRVFGLMREVFRAFAARYVEAGLLQDKTQIFYLTVEEILGVARGTAVTLDLGALASIRQREFEAFAELDEPDERFHTFGAVHIHNRFVGRREAVEALDEHEIVGTPCHPGVVTARAVVVVDPRERPDLEGGILIAHRTDPGWVPLFPTASAVVVERGSLLSHSAVVARELGLPAIVGARGLLDWVQDGEMLTIDGSTGRIRRGTPDE
ncbi:MAG: hypothetical protein KC912_04630 [Proteobacteria bacterium]|nr:hypothetical protein [Pseudomonadota bacterium]